MHSNPTMRNYVSEQPTPALRNAAPQPFDGLVFGVSASLRYALLLACSMLLAACNAETIAASLNSERPATLVDIDEAVQSENHLIRREFVGRVEARRRSEIGFELSGALQVVAVDEGDVVSATSILAYLDTSRLNAEEMEAVAKRDHALIRLSLAERKLDRMTRAAESGGVSLQELDLEKDETSAARAGSEVAEAQLSKVRIDIEKSILTAPYDAVVIERRMDEGQIVAAGQPVLVIQEQMAAEVRLSLPADFATLFVPGDQKQVTIDSQLVIATVRTVLPTRNQSTQTVDVILEIEDSRSVLPGDLARISIDRDVRESGFWMPMSALFEDNRGLWAVYVVIPAEGSQGGENDANYVVEPRSIEILNMSSSSVFVRGEISDGDRFVASGLRRIVPYQIVRMDHENVGNTNIN